MKNEIILDRLIQLGADNAALRAEAERRRGGDVEDKVALLMKANRDLQERLLHIGERYRALEDQSQNDLIRDHRFRILNAAAQRLLEDVAGLKVKRRFLDGLRRAVSESKDYFL